jgi:hypothetical protein
VVVALALAEDKAALEGLADGIKAQVPKELPMTGWDKRVKAWCFLDKNLFRHFWCVLWVFFWSVILVSLVISELVMLLIEG